jgi:fatty-acyl-CoA synthase
LHIVGRLKDMVIRGGEKFIRVRSKISLPPRQGGGRTVIGMPDLVYGEELCAWVRLKPGEHSSAEEMRAFCRGQIAHYKIPRYIRFVDAFPMTVTGECRNSSCARR